MNRRRDTPTEEIAEDRMFQTYLVEIISLCIFGWLGPLCFAFLTWRNTSGDIKSVRSKWVAYQYGVVSGLWVDPPFLRKDDFSGGEQVSVRL